jgi:hypothetical protein
MMVKDGQVPETAMMMIERKTISIMKACELVGVSRRTIYNWIAAEGGNASHRGCSVRIFVDAVAQPSRTRTFIPKKLHDAGVQRHPYRDEPTISASSFTAEQSARDHSPNAELLKKLADDTSRARAAGRRRRPRRNDDGPQDRCAADSPAAGIFRDAGLRRLATGYPRCPHPQPGLLTNVNNLADRSPTVKTMTIPGFPARLFFTALHVASHF